MARAQEELWTAWASITGRIEFQPGVGFPDGVLPICCGTRDALKHNFAEYRVGDGYAIPGITDTTPDMRRVEKLERMKVRMTGREGLMSYFSGMNRRDGL